MLAAVRQIKADVAAFLSPPLIRGVCQAVGHRWRDLAEAARLEMAADALGR
jgi:hypothetical protein